LRNIKLTISYDGSGYHGWQTQPNAKTIQETMEKALAKMTGTEVNLIASGRTDAGVHAIGQVANFLTFTDIPATGFQKGLNSLLPTDIAVLFAEEVHADFHARKWAKEKEYLYRLVINGERLPLLHNRAWVLRQRPDIHEMRLCAKHLEGRHDFTSFMASGSSIKTAIRTVTLIEVEEGTNLDYASLGLKEIRVKVRANGFLRYMVRNMVGFLVEAGLGKRSADDVPIVLEKRDRNAAGPCAPAAGLYLAKVFY